MVEEEVVMVKEGDCCTVIARIVNRRKRRGKGGFKNIVRIPTNSLHKYLLILPFLISVMNHTTAKKTLTLAAP